MENANEFHLNVIFLNIILKVECTKKQVWPDSSSTRHSRELIIEQYKNVSDIHHAINYINYKQQI